MTITLTEQERNLITDEMIAKELEEDRRIGQEQLRKRNGINGKT